MCSISLERARKQIRIRSCLLKPLTSFQGDHCPTQGAHQELPEIKLLSRVYAYGCACLKSDLRHLISSHCTSSQEWIRTCFSMWLIIIIFGWGSDCYRFVLESLDVLCLDLTEVFLSARKAKIQKNKKKGQEQEHWR